MQNSDKPEEKQLLSEDTFEGKPKSRPDDEIDLVDLVGVLWRRRWLMLGIVVVIVGLALAYCFIATPKYEITAQISPGITGFDKNNKPLHDFSAKEIQTWFQKGSYIETLIRLYGNEKKIPKIEAISSRQVNIVTLSFDWPDPEQGKQMLNSLIENMSAEDSTISNQRIAVSKRSIEQEINRIQKDIELIPIEKMRYDDKIEQARNKAQVIKIELNSIKTNIAQSQHTIDRIKQQIEAINRNTQELMQLRQEMVKGDSDKFALLMYSNIIQQNITYVTNLEEQISIVEKEINEFLVEEARSSNSLKDLQLEIKDLVVKRNDELPLKEKVLQKELSTAKTTLSVLLPIEVTQSAFSSPEPTNPAKVKIVAIAFVLGGFLAVLAAFLTEFWVKNRARLTADPTDPEKLTE